MDIIKDILNDDNVSNNFKKSLKNDELITDLSFEVKELRELLDEAVEVISFLEEVGGLNDCGYNNKEDEQHIENFFKKLKDYDERSN